MTSEFLTPFEGRQVGWEHGRAVWWTLTPLRYRSVRLGATVVVPAEMVTDLASVPRAPFAFWLAGGRGTRSAVLHDFPYQFGYWLREGEGGATRLYVAKAEADAVFRESLLADPISGAGRLAARLMHAAVRFGGTGVWRKDARRERLNPEWAAGGGPRTEA